jgi:hypothetical protein
MRIGCGRAVNDPEKLITPAILYASKSGDALTAHIIAIGWWDFHVTFMWSRDRHALTLSKGSDV